MDLYKELLINALEKQKMEVVFPNIKIDAEKIVELKCYQALYQIKAIIEDPSLEDPECFEKIEQIICVLEQVGSDGGFRHDFA